MYMLETDTVQPLALCITERDFLFVDAVHAMPIFIHQILSRCLCDWVW